jgi:hypothetical protein
VRCVNAHWSVTFSSAAIRSSLAWGRGLGLGLGEPFSHYIELVPKAVLQSLCRNPLSENFVE